AGGGRTRTSGDCFGVFESRLAQVAVQVDKARRDDEARNVDHGFPVFGHAFDKAAIRDEHVADLISTRRGIEDAAPEETDHAGNPLSRYSMAMRTATPFLTWSSIADWAPRATLGSISTPSFIGPGCMTTAPGLARASRSSVNAYVRTYSRRLGNRPPVWRSSCIRSSMITSAPSSASASRYVRSTCHGRPAQNDAAGSIVGGPH